MNPTFLKTQIKYNPLTGVFTRLKPWGTRPIGSLIGGLSPQGYWQISVDGKTYSAQRLAWLYIYGEWPSGIIDHINRNKLDNRIENLRVANKSLNAHNTKIRKTNNSSVKGVTLRSLRNGKLPHKPWVAYIMFNGIRKHLGTYCTLKEAANARYNAEKEVYSPI